MRLTRLNCAKGFINQSFEQMAALVLESFLITYRHLPSRMTR